jgi:hypothetical protein
VGEGRVEEGADTCRFVVRNSDVCQSEKQVTYSQTFSNKTKPAHLLRLALAIFYRFLDRHEQIRIVIFRTVHARTDGPSSHGSAREDCAGVQPLLSRRIFPTFPETGKDKRRIVFHPDRVWDFASEGSRPDWCKNIL